MATRTSDLAKAPEKGRSKPKRDPPAKLRQKLLTTRWTFGVTVLALFVLGTAAVSDVAEEKYEKGWCDGAKGSMLTFWENEWPHAEGDRSWTICLVGKSCKNEVTNRDACAAWERKQATPKAAVKPDGR